MKKFYLLAFAFLMVSSLAGAQVISNFNTGITGWEKASDSKYGLDSLFWTHAPDSAANGVMGVQISFHDSIADTTTNLHARLEYGSLGNATYLTMGGAKVLTFWVYLDSAQHMPDSLQIDTYMMNNVHWDWTEDIHYVKDIPKNVWFPLSFNAAQHFAKDKNFDIANNGFMFGLQLQPNKTKWNGKFWVDNIEFLGALPTVVSNFSTAITGWEKASDSKYGLDSLFWTHAPDSAANGVMGVQISFHDSIADTTTNLHARLEYGSLGNATYLNLNSAQFMNFMVYLDSAQHMPDSLQIDTYMMNNVHWDWTEDIHYVKDIPKNVWYPLSFPAAEHYAKDKNFDIMNNGFMFGLQLQPNKTKWNGRLWVDNVEMWNEVVAPPPIIWTAADFETGKNGFTIPAGCVGKLTTLLDTKTLNGTMILQDAVNLKTTPGKIGIIRDSIPMRASVDSTVKQIAMDVYLPNKFPLGGKLLFYVNGGASDSVGVAYAIDNTQLKINSWNTVVIPKLDSLAGVSKFDPSKKARVGITISYTGDTSTFAGNVWFDNLVITGERFPAELLDGVKLTNSQVPAIYALSQNYPNPFNPSTKINYDLPKDSKVMLVVYDLLGREVATLVNDNQKAGSYTASFNATRLASGIYFYRLTAGTFSQTHKMLLLK
ncbi:MAG TPA: T9SS type A sorting domain-containing protein [Bacteroidota bacterium]|nr:T9SS type A sorting domain-containing protein [Bacteroidota bacterium]